MTTFVVADFPSEQGADSIPWRAVGPPRAGIVEISKIPLALSDLVSPATVLQLREWARFSRKIEKKSANR